MSNRVLIKTKLRNITNGRKYATSIINEQESNRLFRNNDIEDILQFHPENLEKGVWNIDYLVVRTRQPYNPKSLFLKSHNNESEDDISYVIYIKSIFEKFDQDKQDLINVTEAYNEFKIAFLYANTRDVDGRRYGESSKWKQDVKACVDHYDTCFKSILDLFCSTRNITIGDTKIIWEDNSVGIEDVAFKNMWIDHYDSIVQYRILCKSCNSRMGSYGY